MQTEQKKHITYSLEKIFASTNSYLKRFKKKSCFDGSTLYINLTEGKHCTFT